MALTNYNKAQIDFPAWIMCRPAPTTTTAISCTCPGGSVNGSAHRYIYYLVSTAFARYDTWSDSWQSLALPNITPTVRCSMSYSEYSGYRGKVISATSNSITIAGGWRNTFINDKLRILSGTGLGQEVTINSCPEPTIYDHGLSSSASASAIIDSTKKWKYNQWAGYQVRIVSGAGVSQVRKILYNDANSLYVYDVNYQQIDPWNNTAFASVGGYTAPTGNVQYYIEATTMTFPETLNPVPDYTSRFSINTGGIWLVHGHGTTWGGIQYYDIATDTWYTKTFPIGIWFASPSTDLSAVKLHEEAGIYDAGGTASSGSAITLTHTGKTWTPDQWTHFQCRIMSGAGIGNRYRIIGNTADTLHLDRPRNGATLGGSSVYKIYADTNKIMIHGNAQAAMLAYDLESDNVVQGGVIDFGTCHANAFSSQIAGQESIPATGFVKSTNNLVTSVTAVPANKGTGYKVGEILNLTTGGQSPYAKVRVETVSTGGLIETVSLVACGAIGGTAYSMVSPTQATSYFSPATGGAGLSATISLATVGQVVCVTTTANHPYKIGDSVTLSGATAGADGTIYNAAHTVVGITTAAAPTTPSVAFEILPAAVSASATAAVTPSTTVICDPTKAWTASELIGKLAQVQGAGYAATAQFRRITANTATSFTVDTAVTSPTNVFRYLLYDDVAFGRASQYRMPNMGSTGWATGGSDTTLIDSTKAWEPGQWIGYKVEYLTGTGKGKTTAAISASTATTLTFASLGATADATTKYRIMDTWGTADASSSTAQINDATKKWQVNQWIGKRVRITSGSQMASAFQEFTITSNTATAILAAFGAIDPKTTPTNYCILDAPVHGAGMELIWVHNCTATALKGREIWRPRGGATMSWDIYDIPTELWKLDALGYPQTETLTTGSMYAYDGADSIFFQKDATGRIYQLNVTNDQVYPAGTIPFGMGGALIGNRMDFITSVDGIKLLYMLRHSGTASANEFFKCIYWWI